MHLDPRNMTLKKRGLYIEDSHCLYSSCTLNDFRKREMIFRIISLLIVEELINKFYPD